MSGVTMPLASRKLRRVLKTITFDGSAGGGAIGKVSVGTVSGTVVIESLQAVCKTDLAGATATVSLGTATVVDGLIGVTTATDLDDGKLWASTPIAGITDAVKDKVVNEDISIDVLTADVIAGAIEIDIQYRSASKDGYIA